MRIIECRPLSKTKRWTLGEVVRRAVQVGVEPSALDLTPDAAKPGGKAPAGKKREK